MENHAASKRERMDETDESGRFYEEPEVIVTKRLRKETNVDVVSEILSKMDNEEVDLEVQQIEEEMVLDMMRMLQEEIYPSSSSADSDNAGTSSNGSDELESTGEYKDCSFNAEFDYLLGANDDELGIPCSPSSSDYDYDCIEIGEAEQQLLLQVWLEDSESAEQEGNDHFCVHNLCMVSTQIQSVQMFC